MVRIFRRHTRDDSCGTYEVKAQDSKYARSKFTILLSWVLVSVMGTIAHAQQWPEIFDPLVLRTLYLDMSNDDWATIQNDETFDIELPAMFWMEEDIPIQISVRRKSAEPLNSGNGFTKVSLKLDINEYVTGQEWYGLRKLSLENGDDQDVVSEGLSWYLHRAAAGLEGYAYDAGLASWVRLIINDVDTGVYLSAEQRDKKFLQNRGIYLDGETWLYKVSDIGSLTLKVGGPEDSPTVETLCYNPFQQPNENCPPPSMEVLANELPGYINLQGMLTLGAVSSFNSNPDAIFSHGKNFYFADFQSGMTRRHFPWDLDSGLGGGVFGDIYQTSSGYSEMLLAVPEFRAQYSQIMNDLICGPLSQGNLHSFLDAIEPVLTEALADDSNNQIEGTIAEHFDNRRQWLSERIEAVAVQIEGYIECLMNGDVNYDGAINVLDVVAMVNLVLSGGYDEAADMNGDGTINVLDVVSLVGIILGD